MMKIITKAACAIIVSLATASCGTAVTSFERLVPKDALMVAFVPDPIEFLKNADEFAKVSGLVGFLGGASPSEALFSATKMDQRMALRMFDLSRPSGAYLSGSLAGSPSFTLLIAVKDAAKTKTWLESAFGPGFAVDGPHGGYLAVRPASQAAHTWKLSSALKPGTLAARRTARLQLGINYQALFSDPAIASQMEGSGARGTVESMRELFSAMGWVSIGIGADAKALSMSMDMTVDAESTYGKLFRGIRAGRPGLAGRMSANEIFGFAANVTVGDSVQLETYMKSMLSLYGLDRLDETIEAYLALMRAVGGDFYVALDVAPKGSVSRLAELGKLALGVGGVADIRDQAAFRQSLPIALRGIVDMYGKLLEQLSAGLGFSLVEHAGQEGLGGPYDAYGLSVHSGGALSQAEETAIGAAFETAVSYGDKRVAFGMGAARIELMKSFLTGSAPAAPLVEVPGYAEIAAYLDPSASAIGHVSVARLGNALGVALVLPITFVEQAPGLLFSASYGPASIRMDAALGAAEFGTYVLGLLPLSMPGPEGL